MTGTQPRLDPFATAVDGRPLEDLSRISASQPYRSDGPRIPYRALDLLANTRGSLRSEDGVRDTLIRADLVSADGTPTDDGVSVGEIWRSAPVQLALNAFALGRRTALVARISGGDCVLAAGETPAQLLADAGGAAGTAGTAGTAGDGDVHVNVASTVALPVLIASWVGLAPAWQFAVTPDRLPPELIEARVADPTVPCPDDADENLRQMWAQPWVDWRIQTTPNGNTIGYLAAGERGQFLSWIEGGRRVLDARPPMHVWRDLLRLVDAALA